MEVKKEGKDCWITLVDKGHLPPLPLVEETQAKTIVKNNFTLIRLILASVHLKVKKKSHGLREDICKMGI
jgi:hypothetical protein